VGDHPPTVALEITMTYPRLLSLSLLLIIAISDFVIAAGYGGAKGKEFFITYEMSNECPEIIKWLAAEPRKGLRIRCSSTGHSPLAGTTYTKMKSKRIKDGCGDLVIVFQCVAGCERKEVPKVIVEYPWEC
jgi:hypothetical protein